MRKLNESIEIDMYVIYVIEWRAEICMPRSATKKYLAMSYTDSYVLAQVFLAKSGTRRHNARMD